MKTDWQPISELPKINKAFKEQYAVIYSYPPYSYETKAGLCKVRGHISTSRSPVRKATRFMIVELPTSEVK
jgi:hypothetical protein